MNGLAYSPKYKLHDIVKYNGKKYMVFEVDTINERYGLTEYIPMYVNSHTVDKSAMIMSGGKTHTSRRKQKTRKTRRQERRYYF